MHERIAALRAAKGWSLRDAATEAGVSAPTWLRAERPRHHPKVLNLVAMARALAVDVNYLLTGAGSQQGDGACG
jgi:transcriptional regulator with XRE-family HTH domain